MISSRLWTHCFRILVIGFALLAAAKAGAAAASPRYVFAHYMVCFATYGDTVDGYKRDIREAQSAGIDGFALNVGAWSGPETYYKRRVEMIYTAAEQLGSGFKLFFSLEVTNSTDIVEMISDYGKRSNSFSHQGKVVVSTFGRSEVDWRNGVFAPLQAQGVGCIFVPHFWPNPVREVPGYGDAVSVLNTYSNLVDGLFLFAAAGLPTQLAQANSNYTAAVHAVGKISMASVAPHYWGCLQTSVGRRYFEFDGGEGIALQWKSIIQNQPDWVEIVTWNDWNESTYISPVENPGQYFDEVNSPRRFSHAGYLALSKRFITWFKTGQEPAVDRDEVIYFYRTHPKDLRAADTNAVWVSGRVGDVQDEIYSTVFLTAPAQFEVSSGSTTTTNLLPAGMSQVRTPFFSGAQTLRVRRGGHEVFSVQGTDIVGQIQHYNFFPTSGNGYPGKPTPPLNVRPKL